MTRRLRPRRACGRTSSRPSFWTRPRRSRATTADLCDPWIASLTLAMTADSAAAGVPAAPGRLLVKAGDNALPALPKPRRRPIWLSMKFPPEFLDEIRARLPVSEVAGTRVKLRKEGREWRGLLSVSAGEEPSFFVNDQKGFFHDFSSGKHGDAFAFLMETEGLTFPEAVERLAGMAGLPMPRLTPAEAVQDKKRASLIEI